MKHTTNLFWDLGNTLLTIDHFTVARQLGLTDIALYPVLDGNSPREIFDKSLLALSHLSLPHMQSCTATAQGRPLPPVVCEWLAGRVPLSKTGMFFKGSLEQHLPEGFFSSKREARLVERLLQVMANPETFASLMRLITHGVTLVQECSEQYDHQGNPRNSLFVLSNWDPYSFKTMRAAPHLQPLFSQFDENKLIISGNIGLIKPDQEIFAYVLSTYQLDPDQCILIDDQEENIAGAQRMGIKGILVQEGNYDELKAQLKAHNVLHK